MNTAALLIKHNIKKGNEKMRSYTITNTKRSNKVIKLRLLDLNRLLDKTRYKESINRMGEKGKTAEQKREQANEMEQMR